LCLRPTNVPEFGESRIRGQAVNDIDTYALTNILPLHEVCTQNI
jgi:hypothetical protein